MNNILISIIIHMLLLMLESGQLSLPITHVLNEENVEQAFENVLPATLYIQAGERYGSGSIYGINQNELIVATAGHLLSDSPEELDITFFDGSQAKGRLVAVSDEADVGFVGIPLSELSIEELAGLRHVRIDDGAYENITKNSRFFMVDMVDDSEGPICCQGAIVEKEMFLPDYDRSMMYGDAYVRPGMSGCGIFDEYGNFVGILSGGTEYNEIAAVPLTEIEEAYKKSVHRKSELILIQ